MTVSNSTIVITTTVWIQRNDSMTLSGNKLRTFKAQYSQETHKIPSLVSFSQLGTHILEPQERWNGLLENHGKFVTTIDLVRGICRAMASTLHMNSYFIPAERECSIDIISFLMYGTSDDARALQQWIHLFYREFTMNSLSITRIDYEFSVFLQIYYDITYHFANSL